MRHGESSVLGPGSLLIGHRSGTKGRMQTGRACFAVMIAVATACRGANNGPPNGSQPRAGTWDTRAALPTARQEMPSALINGHIYTPGGYDRQGATVAVLEIYDVATDRWTSGPPMPEGRNHPGVSAIAAVVLVTGGYTSAGPASSAVFSFNPTTSIWTSRRAMPASRAAHVTVEYGGKLYAMGGVSVGGVTGTADVYDPASDTWTAIAPMPTPREHLAAAVIGDRIYVVGGRAPGNLTTLEAYAPATNTWQ